MFKYLILISLILLNISNYNNVNRAEFSLNSVKVGDTFYFGSYPQTDVTVEMSDVLNTLEGAWTSFNYYSGSGNMNDGLMIASDFMKYKDVEYKGIKYRGVYFDSYRPDTTWDYWNSGLSYINQKDNNYYKNKIYWFKFDPIKWNVLDPSTGLVVCASILDSQAYNDYVLSEGAACWGDSSKTYYANDYSKSSIRHWLNDDFYNTAFSNNEQNNILVTENLDNSNGIDTFYSKTNDRIFLLSKEDLSNTKYGFTESGFDEAKLRGGTDYAKCQGLHTTSDLGIFWWLRSPIYEESLLAWVVIGGSLCSGIDGHYMDVCSTQTGICPALRINDWKSQTIDFDIIDNISLLTDAEICVLSSTIVSYRSKVTITATAENVPEGYSLIICDGTAQLAKGDNKSVSYNAGEMSESRIFTIKVVDSNGNIQKDGSGAELSKTCAVIVKNSFFNRIVAFFKALFGKLPTVEIKP